MKHTKISIIVFILMHQSLHAMEHIEHQVQALMQHANHLGKLNQMYTTVLASQQDWKRRNKMTTREFKSIIDSIRSAVSESINHAAAVCGKDYNQMAPSFNLSYRWYANEEILLKQLERALESQGDGRCTWQLIQEPLNYFSTYAASTVSFNKCVNLIATYGSRVCHKQDCSCEGENVIHALARHSSGKLMSSVFDEWRRRRCAFDVNVLTNISDWQGTKVQHSALDIVIKNKNYGGAVFALLHYGARCKQLHKIDDVTTFMQQEIETIIRFLRSRYLSSARSLFVKINI